MTEPASGRSAEPQPGSEVPDHAPVSGGAKAEPTPASGGIEANPLVDRVQEILAGVFRGIHHIPREWRRRIVQPGRWGYVQVTVADHWMTTYDFDQLTRLVVLCHDAAVRCEIEARALKYVRLTFSQRFREGGVSESHPTMEDAIICVRTRAGDMRQPSAPPSGNDQ